MEEQGIVWAGVTNKPLHGFDLREFNIHVRRTRDGGSTTHHVGAGRFLPWVSSIIRQNDDVALMVMELSWSRAKRHYVFHLATRQLVAHKSRISEHF